MCLVMSTFWDRVDNSDSHLSAQERVGRYQEKEKQDTAHQRGEPGQNPRAISPQTNDIFLLLFVTCQARAPVMAKVW